ncbi:neutral/alkaline non-lysosomal ceramidase N-terminal domain-containing protein [bacterium]|nr:neutral/alkaline non-lysosomal ceramidase N-terminal domain-containing protein [bacterium]
MYHLFTRRMAISIITVMVIALLACCAEKTVQTPSLKVGVGETIITPAGPFQMDGFARSQVSTGVHDDLYARSLVIEDSKGTAIVMMTVALVAVPREDFAVIRQGITDKTGIPPNNIMISATHTHSGPRLRQGNVSVAGAVLSSSAEQSRESIEVYHKLLIDRCIESAVTAWENRVPGRIGVASTTVLELGRNRRTLLYGGLHPDPEVGLIKIEDAAGKLLGIAFNYGCHPSTLDWKNTLFTEDWPYFAIRGIKKTFGEQVWAAFFQSCAGDIGVGYSPELSAVGVDMPVRNYWYAEVKGNQMAAAVRKALPAIVTDGDIGLAAACGTFEYPLREEYPVALDKAKRDADSATKILAELEKKTELAGTRIIDEAKVAVFQTTQRLNSAKRFYEPNRPASRTIEHQCFRIGDAIFVSVPDEVFSEIGVAIKEQSAFEKTFVIALTNGYRGYLPSAREFIEGDYEVDGSVYSPKAEKVCIEACLDMIGRVADPGNSQKKQ